MIRYQCPHCGEALTAAEAKAGQLYICPLCGQTTTVPNRSLHKSRLRELRAIQAGRNLTSSEWMECAACFRVLGEYTKAASADAAAVRQSRRERKAAISVAHPPQASDPQHFKNMMAILLGIFIPFVGLVMGLIRAFSPWPNEKQEAGFWLGGFALGLVLLPILWSVFWFLILSSLL